MGGLNLMLPMTNYDDGLLVWGQKQIKYVINASYSTKEIFTYQDQSS